MMSLEIPRRGRRWLAASLALLLPWLAGSACSRQSEEQGTTAQEQSASAKLESQVQDLKKQLSERESKVNELSKQLDQLREQMPEPTAVQAGDTHWGISYDFLTKKEGLDSETAKRELASVALFDPVLEGNRIWNFYDGSTFGSFVTQNDARVSPGALARAEKRDFDEAKKERDQLSSRVAALEDDLSEQQAELERRVGDLKARLETKNGEVDSLRSYIDSTLQQETLLRNQVADLTERLSSVYYDAGTEASLRAEGKVKSSWIGGPKLGDALDSEDFEQRVDLRESDGVELTAEDLGVPRIENVEVLPSYWKRGEDYRVSVTDDGTSATVTLLNKDQFRLRTLLLLVDS